MNGTATLLILLLLWVIPPSVADTPPTVRVELTVFPPEAEVTVISPAPAAGPAPAAPQWETSESGARRRIYSALPAGTLLRISATGYETSVVHLPRENVPAVLTLEERLFPADGPLRLFAELPTGDGPKSVAFIPEGRVVVPLLWDRGIDVFDVSPGEIRHIERIEPPPDRAAAAGFVEPLSNASQGELWISQMNGDRLHRFDLTSLRYRDSISASGQWPKVMETVSGADGRELLITSNWLSETVVFHDRLSGDLIHEVDMHGAPRGIAVVGDPQEVWVTEFSTGDIVIIDPVSGAVRERLPLGPGAARHIVTHPRDERVYYSDMYHGTVSIIDGKTRELLRTRRLGSNINTIAVDPRGRYLYVSERGRNNPENYHRPGPAFGRIFVVDADTLEPVQTVWGRHQPTGLAVSEDGTLLAATDFLDDTLSIYTVAE
ncbi:MAG: YncE family protein [Alkalispirochaeta sp.]